MSYVGDQIFGEEDVLKQKAARRSEAFDFLLNKESLQMPKSKYSKRDNA